MQGRNKKAPARGLVNLVGFNVVGEAVTLAPKLDAIGASLDFCVRWLLAAGNAAHFLLRVCFRLALSDYLWFAVVRMLEHYIHHIAPLSLIGCLVHLYYSAITRYSPREMNNYSGGIAAVQP